MISEKILRETAAQLYRLRHVRLYETTEYDPYGESIAGRLWAVRNGKEYGADYVCSRYDGYEYQPLNRLNALRALADAISEGEK